MYGSTRIAVIEIARHGCATMCIETEGGHFLTFFFFENIYFLFPLRFE
jgi:hypothetical protein